MLAAITEDVSAILRASPKLLADIRFVEEAVAFDPQVLNYLPSQGVETSCRIQHISESLMDVEEGCECISELSHRFETMASELKAKIKGLEREKKPLSCAESLAIHSLCVSSEASTHLFESVIKKCTFPASACRASEW